MYKKVVATLGNFLSAPKIIKKKSFFSDSFY